MRLPFTPSALHPGFYMVMAMGSFTAGDTTTKLMAGEVPVGQIILIRGLIATIIITLICIQQGVITYVPHLFKRTILARSLSDMLGTIFFITALMHMPIANLTAVMQAVPLVAIGFAALFLGEKVGWRRVLAIAVGLLVAGIVAGPIVARPLLTRWVWNQFSAQLERTFDATLAVESFDVSVFPTVSVTGTALSLNRRDSPDATPLISIPRFQASPRRSNSRMRPTASTWPCTM